MFRRFSLLAAGFVAVAGLASAGGASSSIFTDVTGAHAPNIDAIAEAGVTAGCTPEGDLYCPADLVTRAQMATFLARALGLDPIGGTDQSERFADVSGPHAPNIEAVAQAGITVGCNAEGTLFCPHDEINRAQMASFLARSFDYEATGPVTFDDVSGSHATNITAIAEAGVTLGCNADGTLYCPFDSVRRDHMASFIARAMYIDPTDHRLTLDDTSIGFGDAYVGYTPVNRQVDATNTGQQSLTIVEVSISGASAGDFSVTSGGSTGSLAPGETRTIWIAYDPAAAGSDTATLTVSTDLAEPATAALTGTAIAAGNLAPVVTDPGDLTGDRGDPISLQIDATDPDGDPITFSATGLPDGLSISSSGLITGSLTTSGTSSVIVSADDGVDTGFAQFGWHVTGDAVGGGFDLSIDRFYLTQSVPAIDSDQASEDQVRVIAGRDGLARAFVAASGSNNAAPVVELHWQGSGGSGSTLLGGPGAVPTSPSEGTMGDTFAALLDAEIIATDTEIYVIVDPDDLIDEADETNNRYPASGWLDLEAATLPTMEITFVPITFKGVTPDLSNPGEYLEDALAMLPIADYDVEVRSTPYVLEGETLDWGSVLGAISSLRSSDGSSRMYHGIIDPDYGGGVAGIGYIGYPVAVSWNRSQKAGVVAHELGHNFSLTHAPCGTGGNPSFPYPDGRIGVWGYEMDSGTLYDPSAFYDFMSYCNPVWISDYYYSQVADYRVAAGFDVVEPDAGETTLLVSGTIDGGVATLDPLTQMDVPAVEPTPGAYTLVARDADGVAVFTRPFAPYQAEIWQHAEEVPSGFSFGIVVDEAELARVVSVEIVGASGIMVRRVAPATQSPPPDSALLGVGSGWTWDTGAFERAVLIDPVTGMVTGHDTSGSITVDRPIDVLLSDGIHSQVFQLRP